LREAVAIVFGREDRGLSDFWKERSNAKIRIPMAGICDSLNVSVSVAVICFEALRQRKRIT
jgi:TrmH family RNA methyltransferase